MKVEIKKDPSRKVDWSNVNQLVVSNNQMTNMAYVILIVSGKPSKEECFCGVDLLTGHFSNGWLKSYFELFESEVTLKND